MTEDFSSRNERLAALSAEKAKLLSVLIETQARQPKIESRGRAEGAVRTPASWAQQRLWFIDELEGGGAAYNIPVTVELRGALDGQALSRALNALVCRHESLRTVFRVVAGELVQEVAAAAQFALQQFDLNALDETHRNAHVEAHQNEEALTPFDLRAGPLIRGRLLALRPGEHLLLITMHHIVSDGWSMGIFIRELTELYAADWERRKHTLESLSVQYADYALWQGQWLRGLVLERQLQYWRAQLAGATPLLELPTDRTRPAVQSYRGGTVAVTLDAQLTSGLRALARRRGVTLFMVLYAAWALLLSRLSGQPDVVIGTPVANRRRSELENLIGLFMNMLVLRTEVRPDEPFDELLARVKKIALDAYDHQDTPFEKVVEALKPERSLNRHPIFQVAFALQNAPKAVLRLPGLEVRVEETVNQTAKFDLLLSCEERGDAIAGTFNYATDLFDRETIERWRECLRALLRGIVADEHARIRDLPILPGEERQRVLQLFNQTQASYPNESFVHELFEQQVERTPYAVAVVCADQHLTYRQLNARANQLARYLRERGTAPDRFVGLFVERGMDMVVGALGILKAGAAYVPLDPGYPQQRLEFMLQDTAPIAVLTQERLKDRLPAGTPAIAVDTQCDDIAKRGATNLAHERVAAASSANLAYVIYTSGSTGQPKGVAVEHRNAVNLIWWAQHAINVDVFDEALHSTSMNFDLSVYELFVPLASGGCIRVVRDALALIEHPADVTLINTVPSAIKAMLDAAGIPRATRVINLAGEPLRRELVDRIFAESGVQCVCNLYGPSETTTYSTWVAMPRENGFVGTIGRPIANTQVYILDASGQPVPIGVTGEIYIGGAGVARGYLNRPELTAERFLPDPFCDDSRARMYKTGDLGRWRADGMIEYLGRNDHQVKVRGFRIELGEIETQLRRRIEDAVVIVSEDAPGDKRLVAYLVAADGVNVPGAEELRAYLGTLLPDYMVPAAFVTLPKFPLTPNGKLDRRALPAPDASAFAGREYEPPQGEVEEILAAVWRMLLRAERIGRHDNFFELGGHSLLIVQMLERLRRLGLSTEVRRVFESPTLAALAAVLTSEVVETCEVPPNAIPADCQAITPQMLPLVSLEPQQIQLISQMVPGGAANIQDIYPLVPLQEGILFHHLMSERGGDTYVLPLVLRITSRERLNQFISALQAVVDRHDILRTSVLWEQLPLPLQVVYRRAPLLIEEVTWSGGAQSLVDDWLGLERQRMDLRHAPLMRLTVAGDDRTGHWYVLWQLHHICDDATSRKILISEVAAHLQGRAQRLLPAVAYRQHVARVLAYRHTHDADAFFRAKLAGIDEPTAPFGLLDVHADGARTEEASEELEPTLARSIRRQAGALGVSTATLFHAAWAVVVARTSGRDDVVFGTVLLGRLQGNADTQRMLGMFINTLPLRLNVGETSVTELVERTQREMVELLSHEQASLAAAQRCSDLPPMAPLFTALLNYRHAVQEADVSWAGIEGVEVLGIRTGTNYPITLSIDDLGEGFRLTAQTDRRVDPRLVTAYMRVVMQSLTSSLEQAPGTAAASLPILPAQEWQRLVQSFNATRSEFAREQVVVDLFEQQAELTPETVAVVHGSRSLTYSELNGHANQLARHLRERGVGPGKLVAICVERSPEMVVALLGILKAGGAYIPLDPSYPLDRLQHMVTDAAPCAVLVQERLRDTLPASAGAMILIDSNLQDLASESTSNLARSDVQLTPSHLVYVIFTSGSTGRPKGTAMPHGAMVNLIEWHRATLPAHGVRVLQFAALSFDVAFQETFSTLCTGGTLVMLDEWVRRDAVALTELLNRQRVERLFAPPLMLQNIAEVFASSGAAPLYLLDVITAGEQLRVSPEIVSLFGRLAGCRLHNHYGPTETHVVTALTLEGDPAQWPTLPMIGRPIANTQIYILDARRQPVPCGVAGEIYIGGANVACGYLDRRDLTAERFVADSFGDDPQARLYKTGDLGRWHADGTIEYLGRNDDQVKIRGFRIELGEVEAQLALHPQVREAAVVARQDAQGGKRLVAYVTATGTALSTAELRAHLLALLPEHMTPSAFVVLDSLPLTPSGKLNRRALPVPDAGAYVSRQYEPPHGKIEQGVARIWGELLDVEQVGREDHFFELGGHSLLVIKGISRINQAFGCALRVTDVYKCPTLRQLAAHISGGALEDCFVNLSQEATLPASIVPAPGARSVPPRAMLLTGTTGFVGRFLLARLMEDSDARIYCLVRASSADQAMSRIRMTLAKWDLWREEFDARIVAVPADLRRPRLGLDGASWRTLCEQIDCIHHCATSMNHLETYEMAKAANVESNRELLRIATLHRPKVINYISTLGVFAPQPAVALRIVNEDTPIDRERHLSSRGYVASKWVGEKLYSIARERGIACNVLRLGLVWADSRQGRYDELQRGYRILKSCLLSGLGIENFTHESPLTPVDYAAQAIVHLANQHPDGGGVFHISAATQMAAGVFERCNELLDTSLTLLPWYEWICAMKRLHVLGCSMPVVPLIEFAFSMSAASFAEYQRDLSTATVQVECARTHRELERAGIVAPVLDDELLASCVRSMLSRDVDLRESERGPAAMLAFEHAEHRRMGMSLSARAVIP